MAKALCSWNSGGQNLSESCRKVVGKLSESWRKLSQRKLPAPLCCATLQGTRLEASRQCPEGIRPQVGTWATRCYRWLAPSRRPVPMASSWYLGLKMLPIAGPVQTPRPDGCSDVDVVFIYKWNAVFFLSISISQSCLAYRESPRVVGKVSERGRKVGESCREGNCQLLCCATLQGTRLEAS